MQVRPENVELVRRDYTANGGWETFLSYEDPQQDILVGLLRLRKCAGPPNARQPVLKGRASIVRELHVYGTAIAVHARDASKHQHQVSIVGRPGRRGGGTGWLMCSCCSADVYIARWPRGSWTVSELASGRVWLCSKRRSAMCGGLHGLAASSRIHLHPSGQDWCKQWPHLPVLHTFTPLSSSFLA